MRRLAPKLRINRLRRRRCEANGSKFSQRDTGSAANATRMPVTPPTGRLSYRRHVFFSRHDETGADRLLNNYISLCRKPLFLFWMSECEVIFHGSGGGRYDMSLPTCCSVQNNINKYKTNSSHHGKPISGFLSRESSRYFDDNYSSDFLRIHLSNRNHLKTGSIFTGCLFKPAPCTENPAPHKLLGPFNFWSDISSIALHKDPVQFLFSPSSFQQQSPDADRTSRLSPDGFLFLSHQKPSNLSPLFFWFSFPLNRQCTKRICNQLQWLQKRRVFLQHQHSLLYQPCCNILTGSHGEKRALIGSFVITGRPQSHFYPWTYGRDASGR